MGTNLAYARAHLATNPREGAEAYAAALRQLITDEGLVTLAVQRRFPNYAGVVPFDVPDVQPIINEQWVTDASTRRAAEFGCKELLKALWREHEPILLALERQGNGRVVVRP